MSEVTKVSCDTQGLAIDAIKSLLGLSEADVQHLVVRSMSGGISNNNFLITLKNNAQWVVKLSKGYLSHGLQKEAQAYKLLANTSQGLDARFEEKSLVGHSGALLLQHVSGQTLNQWQQVPLSALTKALKSVHGVMAGTAGSLLHPRDVKLNPALTLEKSWRYFSRSNALQDKQLLNIKARIAAILSQHQKHFAVISPFSMVHGDVHPNNLILNSDNTLQLIDWERAHFGDPAFDLVAINWHASKSIIDKKVQERLINCYSNNPTTQAELQLRANCWGLFRLLTDYLFLSQHQLLPHKREQFFAEITEHINGFC